MSSVLDYPLELNAREYREITVKFLDSEQNQKSFPTGTTAFAHVVDFIGSATYVEFTCFVNPIGELTLTLPKTEADKLQSFTPNKRHYWNLFVVYPTERPVKKVEGLVTVNRAAV